MPDDTRARYEAIHADPIESASWGLTPTVVGQLERCMLVQLKIFTMPEICLSEAVVAELVAAHRAGGGTSQIPEGSPDHFVRVFEGGLTQPKAVVAPFHRWSPLLEDITERGVGIYAVTDHQPFSDMIIEGYGWQKVQPVLDGKVQRWVMGEP